MKNRLRIGGSPALYLFAALVGAAAGAGAVAFELFAGLVSWLALDHVVGYSPSGPRGELRLYAEVDPTEIAVWALLLMPALGGVVSSWLCRTFAREAAGHGTDAVIEAFHRDAAIRARVPIIKALATAVSLGTGGSGGREGPIAQIGAGIASLLGRGLKLPPRQRRILLAAGMGAGVGSIFRAPLAGALFSAEILYRETELESEAIIPSFVASAVAYCLFCGAMVAMGGGAGFDRLFELRGEYSFKDISELASYSVLAVVLVPVVVFYIKFFYGTHSLFEKLPGPRPLLAGIGALLCGTAGLLAWRTTGDERALAVMGYGYGILQNAMDAQTLGWHGAQLLLVVALLKIASTSLTISSGGSGGVFGPSMVIGGGVGGAVGIVCDQLGLVHNPGCLVVVGMCGFFAGAARTPVSTIIMVSEMTGSYELLLPAMWVCGITFTLTAGHTIYISQVRNRAYSGAHRGEYQVALLEKMKVSDIFDGSRPYTTFSVHRSLADVLRSITGSRSDYFPVLDDEGALVGVFSEHDVREFTYDEAVHRLAIVGDLMTTDLITLQPSDDLHTALEKFNIKNLNELPVVADDDPRRLLGVMQRRAIGRAYEKALRDLRELQAANA